MNGISSGTRAKTLSRSDSSFAGAVCASMLAISPILQHYRGPLGSAAITVLVALLAYVYPKLLMQLRMLTIRHLGIALPLVVFYLYKSIAHGESVLEFAHVAVMVFYFVAIAAGYIDARSFIRTATVVAAAASVCVVLQSACFYILGVHLRLVPTFLLLPESEPWILGAQTGLAGITGRLANLYRPSAFFLEPSHMSIYAVPVLCLHLLAPGMSLPRLRMAVLITLGLFLSTSGMGICIAAGLWLLYGGLYGGRVNRKLRLASLLSPRNAVLALVFCLILVVSYVTVPFLNQSINRIFGIDMSETNAIAGRIRLAHAFAQTLSGPSLWFGIKDSVGDVEFNLSGYYATLIKYGIVGTLLSYVFYVRGLFHLKAQYFWLSVIVILISFFTAHTHGTFYMLYYVVILAEGYHRTGVVRRALAVRRVSAPPGRQTTSALRTRASIPAMRTDDAGRGAGHG